MKTKYRIGFFMAVFLFVSLLGIGYQISYHYVSDKQQAESKELEEETESITTKAIVEKNEGFYLYELHGYVAVYLYDRETIYELTDISMDSLPSDVKNEVEKGKYIQTAKELYGFLENYSS